MLAVPTLPGSSTTRREGATYAPLSAPDRPERARGAGDGALPLPTPHVGQPVRTGPDRGGASQRMIPTAILAPVMALGLAVCSIAIGNHLDTLAPSEGSRFTYILGGIFGVGGGVGGYVASITGTPVEAAFGVPAGILVVATTAYLLLALTYRGLTGDDSDMALFGGAALLVLLAVAAVVGFVMTGTPVVALAFELFRGVLLAVGALTAVFTALIVVIGLLSRL